MAAEHCSLLGASLHGLHTRCVGPCRRGWMSRGFRDGEFETGAGGGGKDGSRCLAL